MRALFDINVLLALFDGSHLQHARALDWWSKSMSFGWATSPLTENGYLRIVSQHSYPNPVPLSDAIAVLKRQIAEGGHEFWPDSISIVDIETFDHSHVLGPRQLTDIYLLALAVKNGGRFVTFDRGISLKAVRGASAKHLDVVGS